MANSNDLVRISAEPISQEEVTQYVTHPSAGGISIFLGELESGCISNTTVMLLLFVGVTRDHFEGM